MMVWSRPAGAGLTRDVRGRPGDHPQKPRILIILIHHFGSVDRKTGAAQQRDICVGVVVAEEHLRSQPFASPVAKESAP